MSNLSDGYAAVLAAISRGLEPDPDMPFDEWADAHMIIPADSGANEYGPYRSSRTPHARQVMRALSPSHPCKRVVVMGASQMLKTQVALNMLGATIHQAPSNFLWIVPTGTLVKRSSIRIDKTVRAVPVLAERVASKRSRDAANNLTTKEYLGGTLHILTAGAAANLSEVSARYVVFDEIDRSEGSVQNEGSPGALAEARQTTFEQNRTIYYPSSPTIEGESPIAKLYATGTQRVALAQCIHCGTAQPLEFERLIKSEDGQNAMYPCMECGGIHLESDKTKMFAEGLWSEGMGGDGKTESFHISQMFLPYGWLPWIGLMRLYDKAKHELDNGNENDMIVFYNTSLARCWARAKEQTKYDELMARAEKYRLGTCPAGVLRLTASVDTQADRLELLVIGWGRGMEAWVVDYQVVRGDPADLDTWARLDVHLQTRYPHAYGQTLAIKAAFVDSGGNATQEVYNYTRNKRGRKIFSIKGASRPGRPILSSKPSKVEVRWNGRVEPHGAELWFVGTDTAKDYLANRWRVKSGHGQIHFSNQLTEDFYKQITSEYRVSVWRHGHKQSRWEKKQADRNEALDLFVYNTAAAQYLGLHKLTDAHWDSFAAELNPYQVSLFAAPEDTPPPALPASAPASMAPALTTPSATPAPAPEPAPAPIAYAPAVRAPLSRPTQPARRQELVDDWDFDRRS